MKLDLVSLIMNPFILVFTTIGVGMLLARIKLGRFTFGLSNCLFVGLLVGWGIYKFAQSLPSTNSGYSKALQLIKVGVIDQDFFNLFLVLFIASVGLLASRDLGKIIQKYGSKFIILGFLITFTGGAVTYGMAVLLPGRNSWEITGVYTGALTSSPGLAAALESVRQHSRQIVENYPHLSERVKQEILMKIKVNEEKTFSPPDSLTNDQKEQYIKNAEAGVGVGHSIGYPFGVLVVILAVHLIPWIFKLDLVRERGIFLREVAEGKEGMGIKTRGETTGFDLLGFIIVCLLGYFLGEIRLNLGPLGYFSLGSTGGVLFTSLLLGYFGKISIINFRMNHEILGIIREISLAFFLAIVGLRYGYYVFSTLTGYGIYLVIISLIVGLTAILIGYLVGRYIFKLNWIILVGAICGGMTSTPGLGAAIEAIGSDEPAAGYGAIYPFALLGMVIFSITLHILPI